MIRRAVVLAGGRGSRLAPVHDRPAEAADAGRRPRDPGDRPAAARRMPGSTTSRWRSATSAHLIRAVVGDGRRTATSIRYHDEERGAGHRRAAGHDPGPRRDVPDAQRRRADDARLPGAGRALTSDAGNVLTIATHRRAVRADYGVLHDGRPVAAHRPRRRLRGEARAGLHGQHGRLRARAERGRARARRASTTTCRTSCLALLADRRAGRLLPVRRLLARHRARGRLPARAGRRRTPRARPAARGRAMTRRC